MKPAFSVLDSHKWPGGLARAVAILREDPETLSARLALHFHDDVDDLDRLQQAYLRLPSGRVVVLRRHANHPVPGTPLYSDVNDSVGLALEEVMLSLELQPSDIAWVADEDE